MTTGTTESDTRYGPRRPRWLKPWIWSAAAAFHLVLLAVLGPWAYTAMTFDPAEEQQRTEMVKAREAERLAAEEARRERVSLSKQDAQQLKREEADRRLPQLREHVRQLQEQRQAMQEFQQQRLNELAERQEKEIAAARMARLQEEARWLEHRAKDVTERKTEDVTTHERIDALVKQMREQAEEAVKDPEDYQEHAEQMAEAAREIQQLTDHILSTESEDHTRRFRAKELGEQAQAFEQEAAELSQGVDMADATAGIEQARQEVAASGATDEQGAGEASDDPVSAAAGLYEQAREAEQAIGEAFAGAKAAERAAASGTSLKEAAAAGAASNSPSRPDLGTALAEAQVGSIADLVRLGTTMDRAVLETSDMARRSGNLMRQATGQGTAPGQVAASESALASRANATAQLAARNAARGEKGRVINMTAFTSSAGSSGGQGMTDGFVAASEQVALRDGDNAVLAPDDQSLLGPVIRINPDVFGRQTLPGRMITDASDRKGWLYIDTWYIIGPWENEGELSNTESHPPEDVIDLDAVYLDGKFADDPDLPLHTLSWEFYQSDQLPNQPPQVFANSTYYAYTELYSDRDREVLFTISTDDAAKVWLNDQLIWEDVGGSPWQVGEGFRRVTLAQGYNRLLVRIANGPVYCVWSVLFCPVELATQ